MSNHNHSLSERGTDCRRCDYLFAKWPEQQDITITRDDLAHHCAAFCEYQAGILRKAGLDMRPATDLAHVGYSQALLTEANRLLTLGDSLTSHLWGNLAMISQRRALVQIEAGLTPELFAALEGTLNKLAALEAMLATVVDKAREGQAAQ